MNCMPYHVRITRKSHRIHDEVRLDLIKKELEERFLAPYRDGRSIVIGGATVRPDNLERIQINYAEKTSEQLPPLIRVEHRMSFLRD